MAVFEMRCCGTKQTGYWKGYPCGARGKYEKDGKFYCANHIPEVMILRGKALAKKVKRK